jgi:hypothetical protein
MWCMAGTTFNNGRFTIYDDQDGRIVFSLDEYAMKEMIVRDLLLILDSVNSRKGETKMRCACDEHEPEMLAIPEAVYQYDVVLPNSAVRLTGNRAYVEDGGLCIFDENTMVACWTPGEWRSMTANSILPTEEKIKNNMHRAAVLREMGEEPYCDE